MCPKRRARREKPARCVDARSASRARAWSDAASPRAMGERARGKVKWFNVTKGFGFITPHDGREEIFVHQTGISRAGFRSAWEGEEVEYEIRTDDGRSRAVNVTGLDGKAVKGAPRRRHRNRLLKGEAKTGSAEPAIEEKADGVI